jgi:tRNA A37 threonylcarbamoyladenosine synthetase subunit TsaC/SUA5/YrdC
MAAFRNKDLPNSSGAPIYTPSAEGPTDSERREKDMPENKNDFRKALAGVIDARGREATRSVSRAREHLLLGALTKRPN